MNETSEELMGELIRDIIEFYFTTENGELVPSSKFALLEEWLKVPKDGISIIQAVLIESLKVAASNYNNCPLATGRFEESVFSAFMSMHENCTMPHTDYIEF